MLYYSTVYIFSNASFPIALSEPSNTPHLFSPSLRSSHHPLSTRRTPKRSGGAERAGASPQRRPAYTIGYPQYFTPTLYKIIFFNAPLKRPPAGSGPLSVTA